VFGLGAYVLGENIEHLTKPVALALALVGLVALIAWVLFLRVHEKEFQAEAECALPGPLIKRTIKRATTT
jgi:hypothetical protein